MKIISTTDGKFIGREVIDKTHVDLDDYEFIPDRIVEITPGIWRLSNTNYVIDVQE